MSDAKPARFAPYSRREIELHNLVVARRPSLRWKDSTEAPTLTLGASIDAIGVAATVRVGTPGAHIWLEIGAELLRLMCSPWAGDESIESLPPKLAEAVMARALAPLLEGLGELTGTEMSVLDRGDPAPEHAVRLGLGSSSGAGSAVALLHLDDAAVSTLVEALERQPSLSADPDLSGLQLRFQLVVGRSRVTVGELHELEVGDVLLMAAGLGGPDGDVLLFHSGHALAVARVEERSSIVIKRLLESPMSDIELSTLLDEEPAASQLDRDRLQVELTFDLGQVSLPLAELNNIRAGYTFELNMPASGAVRIISGSEAVGRGELVQIDDRLGVRVTRIWKSSGD